jgi:hypothetical protein
MACGEEGDVVMVEVLLVMDVWLGRCFLPVWGTVRKKGNDPINRTNTHLAFIETRVTS